MNVISIISNPIAIFWIAFALVVATIIILTLIEKKLKKKIEIQTQEESYYKIRIEKVKQQINEPHEFIVSLSELTQDFFNKEFGIEKGKKYSELIEIFEKKDRKDIVKLCENIQEALYSGNNLDKEVLEYLLRELVFLIKKQKKIPQSIEEEQITKNNEEKMQNLLKQSRKAEEEKQKINLYEEKPEGMKELNEKQNSKEIPSATINKNSFIKPEINSLAIKTKNRAKNVDKKYSEKNHYYDYIGSFDNLDRVKNKLIKSGKNLRF